MAQYRPSQGPSLQYRQADVTFSVTDALVDVTLFNIDLAVVTLHDTDLADVTLSDTDLPEITLYNTHLLMSPFPIQA